MFLLDTNVVSELLRPSPDPAVETWVGDCRATHLYFSAIGEAELRYGVAILPAGRRQAALASAIAAARCAADRTVSPADCQIAAIARSRDLTVATRNVRDFESFDVEVVDPWTAA